MARKITHTKRGTYYNGPTGRHKVSDPLGSLLFSAAKTISKSSKSSKTRKSTAGYNSYSSYSSGSNEGASSAGCIGLCIVLLVIVVFLVSIFSKCSSSSSHHSNRRSHGHWQHPERYRPKNKMAVEKIADPWQCFKYISDNVVYF
jgi:hypothetical protein